MIPRWSVHTQRIHMCIDVVWIDGCMGICMNGQMYEWIFLYLYGYIYIYIYRYIDIDILDPGGGVTGNIFSSMVVTEVERTDR